MSQRSEAQDLRLIDLDAPKLGSLGEQSAERFLLQLQTQNTALSRLRKALDREDEFGAADKAPIELV